MNVKKGLTTILNLGGMDPVAVVCAYGESEMYEIHPDSLVERARQKQAIAKANGCRVFSSPRQAFRHGEEIAFMVIDHKAVLVTNEEQSSPAEAQEEFLINQNVLKGFLTAWIETQLENKAIPLDQARKLKDFLVRHGGKDELLKPLINMLENYKGITIEADPLYKLVEKYKKRELAP
jgi:hypothetical protein